MAMDGLSPTPVETGTFIDVMKVGSEWFVLVVEDGRETANWFSIENAAMAYASAQGTRLKVEKIDIL
jgi:hypothetical protein